MTVVCIECGGEGTVVRQYPGTDDRGLALGCYRVVCPRCEGDGRLVSLHEARVARMVAEFNEHPNASGPAHTARLCPTLLREEHGELQEALAEYDRAFMDECGTKAAALARELADLVYVAYTTAWAHSIDLDAALAEIHRAAMDKVAANVRRPSDGKIVKPPGFVPPDMSAALNQQAAS